MPERKPPVDNGWYDSSEEEEDDFDDDDYDGAQDGYQFWGDERAGPNSQAAQALNKSYHTTEELFRKFSSKINVEKYEGVERLPSGAGNKILTATKRAMSQGLVLIHKIIIFSFTEFWLILYSVKKFYCFLTAHYSIE